jgi:hypothetical protein
MNPEGWTAANLAQDRLERIHAAYGDIPDSPALERLFRTAAWDLSPADLEAFCAIPAVLRNGASTCVLELPL